MADWSPGIQKVLAHLKRTRGKGWHLEPPHRPDRKPYIRRHCGAVNACPITSPFRADADRVEEFDSRLGLTDDEADAIVNAADGMTYSDAALRAALLEAAGLAE